MIQRQKDYFIGVHGFLCFILCCVFVSCGFDVFYYLEPPWLQGNPSNSDPLGRVYSFRSNATGNSGASDDIFRGTVVYYRIYNGNSSNSPPSALLSDSATINAQNAQYSTTAANTLQRLGYQALSGQVPLVPKSTGNAEVRIRLFTESGYERSLVINGVNVGIPMRFMNSGFDFFASSLPDSSPQNGDIDTTYTTGYGNDIWYVNAYALSYGMDTNFSAVYSSAVYLGYILISQTP